MLDCCLQDLDVYQDLSQHIVKCKVFTVKVDIDLDDEIALLQRALRGIAKLPWEGVTVQLAEVDWTDAAAEAVTAALPTLTHLNLTTDIHKCTVLTDALLGLVLQLAPNMRSLHVWSLSLQSDQHANTPWPWEELTIDMLDIGQLGRLPMPAHDAMTTIRSQKIELLSVDEQVRSHSYMKLPILQGLIRSKRTQSYPACGTERYCMMLAAVIAHGCCHAG